MQRAGCRGGAEPRERSRVREQVDGGDQSHGGGHYQGSVHAHVLGSLFATAIAIGGRDRALPERNVPPHQLIVSVHSDPPELGKLAVRRVERKVIRLIERLIVAGVEL